MINIEITKGWKKNHFSIRMGDIEGSSERFNITEEELIEEIKAGIEALKKKRKE